MILELPPMVLPTFPGFVNPGVDPNAGTITVSEAQQLALLYEAALNRPADLGGLNFWIDQFEAGQSFASIADYFVNSPEFSATFGNQATISNHELIDLLYLNILDRPGEPDGVAYWTGRLDAGDSRAQILLEVAVSPENVAGSAYVQALHNNGVGDWSF